MMNAGAEVRERRQCPARIAHFSLLYNCSDLSGAAWSGVGEGVWFCSMLTKRPPTHTPTPPSEGGLDMPGDKKNIYFRKMFQKD